MALGLRLNQSLELQLRCPLCKQSSENHAADCLQRRYEELQAQKDKRMLYECSRCRGGWVEVNLHDNFECRACHTQFSAGEHDDNGTRAKTYLYPRGSLQPKCVVVLEVKGDSKFPFDDQLEALGKQIEEALAKAAQEEWEELEQT